MDTKKRPLLLAVIFLILSISNYSRLSGTECVRTVTLLTLMTMGGAIVIVVQQLLKRYKEKQN